MNIRLADLAEQLTKYYHVRCSGDMNKNITGISFVDGSIPLSNLPTTKLHVLLLRSMNQLVGRSNDLPVLCIVNPENLAVSTNECLGAGIIISVFSQSAEHVLMTLNQITYTLGQQVSPLSNLSRELLGCRSLEQSLAVSFSWLNNPLILADNYQNILAHTHLPSCILPKESQKDTGFSIFLDERHIPDTINAMELSMLSGWPSTTKNAHGEPLVTCKTLSSCGKVMGYLFVYYTERSHRAEDDGILEVIGNHFAMLLREQDTITRVPLSTRDPLQDLLQIVIDKEGGTRSQVERIIDRNHLILKPYHYILALSPTENAGAHPIHGLLDVFCQAVPFTMGTYFQNTMTLLIESDHPIREFESAWDPLAALLKTYGYRAGIGNVCLDIMDMKNQFFQAKRALTLGHQFFPDAVLIPYYKCAPLHVLELAATYHSPMDFCDPGILELQTIDKENNSSLLETLRVYLECGRNKTLTAQRLFLHPNSVKYRLKQINDILCIESGSFADDMRLYQSLLLLHFNED